MSPWKRPKPTSLPMPPVAKPSLNPFDGLEDDQLQGGGVQDRVAPVSSSGDGLTNGYPDRKSHDNWTDVKVGELLEATRLKTAVGKTRLTTLDMERRSQEQLRTITYQVSYTFICIYTCTCTWTCTLYYAI